MENARSPDACPVSTHGFLRPLPVETALIVFPGSARSLFDSNDFLFDSTNFLFASKNFLFDSNNPSVPKPWALADADGTELLPAAPFNVYVYATIHESLPFARVSYYLIQINLWLDSFSSFLWPYSLRS